MLHGRGADENDLFELAPAVDPVFAIASVRAPLTTDEGGYTWSKSRSVGRAIPQSLRESITWFRSWLTALDRERAEPQQVFLMGFSAGMAMAAALVLDEPSRFGGAILLSGTLPFDTDVPITKNRLNGVPIFHGHGSFDTVIPADLITRTDEYLSNNSGAVLTDRRYLIAHQISEDVIRDFTKWLMRYLATIK
ncbi:MAG: hypothetical protein M3R51_03205 [Candidatus Eremiobacteraeota bacterium]|nr:hypothetical protein [Candidatus Eremiobacteraeota bacterium]